MGSEMAEGGSATGSEGEASSGKMTLGKRERSLPMMPRMRSMASLPSAPKQGRLTTVAAGGNSPHVPSSFLPAITAAARPSVVGGGDHLVVPMGHSGEVARWETAEFLKACGICGRRLGPGKVTYIYRGEAAFCSKECREAHIERDEHMERNCSLTSIKASPSSSGGGGGSDPSDSGGSGETVVAT